MRPVDQSLNRPLHAQLLHLLRRQALQLVSGQVAPVRPARSRLLFGYRMFVPWLVLAPGHIRDEELATTATAPLNFRHAIHNPERGLEHSGLLVRQKYDLAGGDGCQCFSEALEGTEVSPADLQGPSPGIEGPLVFPDRGDGVVPPVGPEKQRGEFGWLQAPALAQPFQLFGEPRPVSR